MRKLIPIILAFSFVLPLLFAEPTSSPAQAGDASQLIAEVNALRAAYGLSPYEVNSALMSSAQKQSDYQASIGGWTHTGSNGSRPHDRAVAAGYGGGAQVFVSENVAMGIDLSASRTVNEMWQDAIHLETMISPRYTHIGAGVSQAEGWVYYTIVVGYIAGSAGSGTLPEQPPATSGTDVETTPIPTVVPIEPIAISAPSADGSIQHVVQLGQFLENIANAYEMELSELMALNGLSDQSVIYPGDKLLIKASSISPPDSIREGAPTTDLGPTNVPTSTATEKPVESTSTPVPIALKNLPPQNPTAPAISGPIDPNSGQTVEFDYLLYAVFGLAIAGTAMILLGSSLKRRS